jgi:hypothetical protein
MSGFFASVNGLQIVAGSLMIPLRGCWTADLELATAAPLSGSAVVSIGNLTLHGFIYRSEPYGGQVKARLVGGFGGWRQTIQQQGYGSGGGVLLAHVLADAASACGEQVAPAPGIIGTAFTRVEGPASDVLWQLVSQGFIPGWYVAPSGITQVTPWPSLPIGTPFTVTGQKPDEGIVQIATEDYASWMPGCTFTAPQLTGTYQNGGVVYNFGNDGQMRFEVLTGTTDRLLGALTAFIGKQIAPTRFYGRYAYSIVAATTETVDCTPQDLSLGLPTLQQVPLRSDAISSYLPPPGEDCDIMFLDGVPTAPICVWTGGPPETVAIGEVPAPLATASAVETIAGALITVAAGYVTALTPPGVPSGATATWAIAAPAIEALWAAFGTTVGTAVVAEIPTKTITAGP